MERLPQIHRDRLYAGGVVLALALLVIRKMFGVLVVTASAVVSAVLWFYASPPVQGCGSLVRGFATEVGVYKVRAVFLHAPDVRVPERHSSMAFPVVIGAASDLAGRLTGGLSAWMSAPSVRESTVVRLSGNPRLQPRDR
jgi:hypothetical protein